jgi:hypothetical protein
MNKDLLNLFTTRREMLQWLGLTAASTIVNPMLHPLQASAQRRVNPLGTARNAIMVKLSGAMSPMDCWDFKETRWTPADLNPRRVWPDLQLSQTLFPRLSSSKVLERVSFVRSMRAKELVHFTGHYHLHTGRALNPAVAKEIPDFGTVIAAELDSQRRDSDTFPTYMSTNLVRTRTGIVGSGFFPPRFTGLDLDTSIVFNVFGGNDSANADLVRRWERLQRLTEVNSTEAAALGDKVADYDAYYDYSYRILRDPRWAQVFQVSDEDKQRYGDGNFNQCSLLARNILKADAGARFVFITNSTGGNGPLDHHAFIFDRTKPNNHYIECARIDQGLTALLEDLAALPGQAPGKSLLDETLVIATSEFGRMPYMNSAAGRDHYNKTFTSMLVGGGVQGGRILGRTNADCSECLETGWRHKDQPAFDNLVSTFYSALGIDWTKKIEKTPSGRSYEYVQTAPLGESNFIPNDPINELFT